jgi:hypothetical protein
MLQSVQNTVSTTLSFGACKPPLEISEGSYHLGCSTHGRILHRTVPVSLFLTAAPDWGETIVVSTVMDHV